MRRGFRAGIVRAGSFSARQFSFILLAVVSAATSGCAPNTSLALRPQALLGADSLSESSGAVVSHRFKNVLWTHNDSNNAPEVFAFNLRGRLLAVYPVPQSVNVDWEDIALESDQIYILDNTSRSDPEGYSDVYVFPEPDPHRDRAISQVRRLRFQFPENDGPYDCETLLVRDGYAYLVTKPWDGLLPRIYRGPIDGGRLEFAGHVPVHTMITGGDISADGRRIVLSSYRALLVFEGEGEAAELMTRRPLICQLNARQVEAVAWHGESILLTNEQREVYRLSPADWRRQAAPFPRRPEKEVPFAAQPPLVESKLGEWSKGQWLRVLFENRTFKMGRLVWSPQGLHIGLELPPEIPLSSFNTDLKSSFDGWFRPGVLYLLINPDGLRPLSYGEHDRCLVFTRNDHGRVTARSLSLRPATFVQAAEEAPAWVGVEEHDNRLLVTIRPEAPGLRPLEDRRKIGFNMLLVTHGGNLASWAPLTRRFSWDQPNVWGLLQLED